MIMISIMLKSRVSMKRDTQSAFALPTVLIASIVMLIVLLSSVSAASSVRVALDEQFYMKLAQEAAEAGQARAEACLEASAYIPTWDDTKRLRPDTTCAGVTIGGGNKYIAQYGNLRTTFIVWAPVTGTASAAKVTVVGTTELIRSSGNVVHQSFSHTAVRHSSYDSVPQIASGAGWKLDYHNGYMLATNGTLYGWGDNVGSQIGDSAVIGTQFTTPVKVGLPTGVTRVKKVFNSGQGASILCILASDDQAYCRGTGGLGGSTWTRFGTDPARKVIDMVVNGYGTDNACVITDIREVWCAGVNDYGQLGAGIAGGQPGYQGFVPIASPTKFRLDLANPAPPAGTTLPLQVMKLEMKDWLTCVIASDARAYCAGVNNLGQLGQGTTTVDTSNGKATPGRALLPGDQPVTDIKLPYHGSYDGVFYLGTDSVVYMSGHNARGTANDGNSSGSLTATYSTPKSSSLNLYGAMISVGSEGNDLHTMCIVRTDPTDGAVWCMGDNNYGQTGNGGACGGVKGNWVTFNLPVGEKGSAVLNVEAGYQMNSVMVLTVSGNVYAAGDNTYGKLGTGAALGA
jgi:alpha-tubulin suppressor-like RCC1 family protein